MSRHRLLYRHLVFTGPEPIRVRFKDRYQRGLISEAAAMRPRKGSDPVTYTTNLVIRDVARRIQRLDVEIAGHRRQLTGLITEVAPSLLELHGVGSDTAATLLVAAGDNQERIHSEPAWAHLCGTAPIPSLIGQDHPASHPPWRRPQRQLGVVSDRDHPDGLPRRDPPLCRSPPRRGPQHR